MLGIGSEHDITAPRLDPHTLQSARMAADQMHADARGNFIVAVMEGGAAGE